MTNSSPPLIFSTAPFFRQPLRDGFRLIADAGFEAIEVMVTQDPSTQEPHLLNRLAAEFGLRVEAIHAPFLLVTRRVFGADPIGKIHRSVHLAEETGARLVVVHPPYRWQGRYLRWATEDLAEFSAHTGVNIAVENMFPVKLPMERGMTFHASQEYDDLDAYPHLVLDTSHAAVAGIDIRDAYQRYGHKLRHIHLSNNAGRGWDSHLPVYQEGVLPVGRFLEDLARGGFDGGVSIELDLRRWMRDREALLEVLVRNREFCEARLSPVGADAGYEVPTRGGAAAPAGHG
jgi:sugar phosphate isomerase/epimerase